jgi:hypothetical protein
MATPAQLAADRRHARSPHVLAIPRCGRSKPEFCQKEPIARPNLLIYFKLGIDGFRGKLSKTRGKPSKTISDQLESPLISCASGDLIPWFPACEVGIEVVEGAEPHGFAGLPGGTAEVG